MDLTSVYRPIQEELAKAQYRLDEELLRILAVRANSEVREYVSDRVGHAFATRGKMLRPALVLFSCRLAAPGEPISDDTIAVAAGVELIHLASLVHDDIIDHASHRRGSASLNASYGNRTAVLVGDIIYAQFFALLCGLEQSTETRALTLLSLFSDTTRAMCVGELHEQRCVESGTTPSAAEYVEILTNKTASLMSACCRAGAVMASAHDGVTDLLGDFGGAFGVAFQLADDVADADSLLGGASLDGDIHSYRDAALASLSGLPPSGPRNHVAQLTSILLEGRTLGV